MLQTKPPKQDLEYWTNWSRNVKDEYKQLSNEDIKATIKKNTLPFAVLCAQVVGDFAFGTIIRTANGLGAQKVFYHGYKKFDRRSALGTYVYTDVEFLPSFEDIVKLKSQYRLVALENNIAQKPIALKEYVWQENSLLIFGEEGCGISQRILDICDDCVEIPMMGSVRSYNVGCGAAIAMWDFVSKTGQNEYI